MEIVARRRMAGAMTLVILAAVVMAVVPAAAQEGPPECPPAPDNAIVINLPFEELYANRGDAAAIGSTVSADVPAGLYDIRITGWDDHVIGDTVKETQLTEVFIVQGMSGGAIVFSSGETPDLPDDQNTVTAFVNHGVAVPDLDSLRAVHSQLEAQETANSIHPICIVFVPVQQDTTTTTVGETTTTTAPETTTTSVEVSTTSTTVPGETTSTTVPGETTSTTAPAETTTTTIGDTTTTVQVAPTSTPSTTPETLPFTGVGSDDLALVAFLALVAGSGLVLMTRQSAEAKSADIV